MTKPPPSTSPAASSRQAPILDEEAAFRDRHRRLNAPGVKEWLQGAKEKQAIWEKAYSIDRGRRRHAFDG